MKLITYASNASSGPLFFLLFGSLLLGILMGCQQDYLPADLVRYVQNPQNGLRAQKQLGELYLDWQYQPSAYIIANEQRSNHIDPSLYEQRSRELAALQYYTLKIGVRDGKNDITTYGVHHSDDQQNRLYYLSFRLQEDLRLVQGRDTLRPTICHFERNYGLANHRTFVLAFPQSNSSADRQLLLQSDELGIGPLKMTITQSAIHQLPSIKLQP